jgi:hypothetical protein
MAEPGWPLIPREVLPAPVPAVRRAHPRQPVRVDAGRQLSIFGAETIEPSPADLAGLLAGPGRLDRMGGTARVSVRVDAAWRVHVLVHELVSRGLAISWLPVSAEQEAPPAPHGAEPGEEGEGPEQERAEPDEAEGAENGPGEGDGRRGGGLSFEVRTAYSSRLNGLARAWPAAADKLFLSGPRLRLWVAAGGVPRDGGYALSLGTGDVATVDAALVRAGLAGTVSDDGRDYLVLGGKRLRRLAELVGDRPSAAPVALWPNGAAS